MLSITLFVFFSTAFLLGPSAVITDEVEWNGLPSPASSLELVRDRYEYSMRGSVRILFFWIGKDGVGGGTISRIKAMTADPKVSIAGIEVLFGSDPERVPGQANRWGYARELAFRREQYPGESSLERTLFEGFMSKSSEESLSQVRRNEADQHEEASSPYEGLTSRVEPFKAVAEIRRFSAAKSINFKNPGQIGQQFERLLAETGPDETRVLDNAERLYREPLGFLTAIDRFMSQALETGTDSKALSRLEGRSAHYVYNARLYLLELDDTKLYRKYKLTDQQHFRNVVKLKFKVTRIENGNRHEFSIWTPVEGEMKGVPIRIEDRPRWWLKVELYLENRSLEQVSVPVPRQNSTRTLPGDRIP